MDKLNTTDNEKCDQLASQPTCNRRSFFGQMALIPLGFLALCATLGVWMLGVIRFFHPNASYEKQARFSFSSPELLQKGEVDTSFKEDHGVWIVRADYEDQDLVFVLRAVCTHLGCTPIWDENEAKFKCPCHGSRFNIDGMNLEGPAPRPLERVAVRMTEDGQLDIDPDKTYRCERGQWNDPASYVLM